VARAPNPASAIRLCATEGPSPQSDAGRRSCPCRPGRGAARSAAPQTRDLGRWSRLNPLSPGSAPHHVALRHIRDDNGDQRRAPASARAGWSSWPSIRMATASVRISGCTFRTSPQTIQPSGAARTNPFSNAASRRQRTSAISSHAARPSSGIKARGLPSIGKFLATRRVLRAIRAVNPSHMNRAGTPTRRATAAAWRIPCRRAERLIALRREKQVESSTAEGGALSIRATGASTWPHAIRHQWARSMSAQRFLRASRLHMCATKRCAAPRYASDCFRGASAANAGVTRTRLDLAKTLKT